MKTPKFDGSTNLEQALGIMPVSNGELLPIEDDIEDELILVDNMDVDNSESMNMTIPDQEIKDSIDELYDRAVNAFDDNMDQMDSLEPKYVSRSMEVSKGYLDMALEAVKLKQQQVEHSHKMQLELKKLKNKSPAQNADVINNNIIVADRNELLKQLRNKNNDKF